MNYFTITVRKLIRLCRVLTIIPIIFGLIHLCTPVSSSAQPKAGKVDIQTKQVFKQALVDKWGIELTALRLTAAGRMIDFRYRVLDKEKAAPLHERQIKPYLVHQASGKVLAVPNTAKVGALRNSNMPQEDRIYWMFFGNNGTVKKGDKVGIVIGDFRADDLIVE